jgi:very-short-patch-repair endonuclease
MVSDATKQDRSDRIRLQGLAKRMRREPTAAEARFWHYAKGRGLGGLKFKRQVPLGPYIADFLCAEHKLIVEIDGGQHGEDRDKERDAALSGMGYRILRFWNTDVLMDMGAVADTILAAVTAPPHPALSP